MNGRLLLYFLCSNFNLALERLPEIGRLLLKGGVISVPTDTIYGIACSALDTSAIKRIYAIKGRDFRKPMAICIDKVCNSLPLNEF